MKTLLKPILSCILICYAIGINGQSFIDQASIQDDGFQLVFNDNPKKLKSKKEYEFQLFHTEYSSQEITIICTNGYVKKRKPDDHGRVYYTIKPSKRGEMVLSFFVKVDGKNSKKGSRTLEIK